MERRSRGSRRREGAAAGDPRRREGWRGEAATREGLGGLLRGAVLGTPGAVLVGWRRWLGLGSEWEWGEKP